MTKARSPGLQEGVHFFAYVYLVVSSVRSRIGRHDETISGHDAQAISHSLSPIAMLDGLGNGCTPVGCDADGAVVPESTSA